MQAIYMRYCTLFELMQDKTPSYYSNPRPNVFTESAIVQIIDNFTPNKIVTNYLI